MADNNRLELVIEVDVQRGNARRRASRGTGLEPEVMLAPRTDRGALEDGRPTVRAGPRRPGNALARDAHAAVPPSIFMLVTRVVFSSQPNST